MSTTLDQIETATEIERPRRRPPSRILGSLRRLLAVLLKLAIGILLCANPWTAVLVVGWSFRLMNRRIVRGWFAKSPGPDSSRWDAASTAVGYGASQRVLPRWIVSEAVHGQLHRRTPSGNPPGRFRILIRLPLALTLSFWSNLQWGVMAVFCTYVLTIPACGLWLGSWYDGWNTSFTKGYENAFVGAQTGIFAHVLFIAAMLYVPMAWGHLAASGRLSAFFQFDLISRLIWKRGWTMTFFAAAFAVATLPILALRGAGPLALLASDPEKWAEASPGEIAQVGRLFQLGAGIYVFGAFVLLHVLIARIYRSALLDTLQQNPRLYHRLPDSIRATLFEFGLTPEMPRTSGPILRAARWSYRTVSNVAAIVVASILWFAVIAQIYVGQFINYIPWAGWLNQPLIHLPCIQTFVSS